MARYQVILSYDGTGFSGSQRQAKARTVQGELERALEALGWAGRSVLLAGRTDTGVHALGQAAAFDLDWQHTPAELQKALNAGLPMDLAVRGLQAVRPDFHPRYDALSRWYRYRLFCQEVRHPLQERFAWRVWPPPDAGLLADLARLWPGSHDFGAFGTPPKRGQSTVRTVLEAGWQEHEGEWWFDVRADGFLYRMVRRLVFVQVAAAQGRLPVDSLVRALQERTPAQAGTAPAHGLMLMEVTYPPDLQAEKSGAD
jgi:tRNA pseudouridine38-40 synthase